MRLSIPELSLVLLLGPSGAGKSAFAWRHFRATETVSLEGCRAMVRDDPRDPTADEDALELLLFLTAKRLAAGKLTVIDAPNVHPEARRPLLDLARAHDCLAVAIALDVPEATCFERLRARGDRRVDEALIRTQSQQLHRSLRGLRDEGFRHIHVLTPRDIERAFIRRRPHWSNRRDEHGPFDVIGDVHGCLGELEQLLARLGYVSAAGEAGPVYRHPDGRKVIFLGDLVDRGPGIAGVLRLVMNMVRAGTALCVQGNHEVKLLRKLQGKNVRLTNGLAQSIEQLAEEPQEFRQQTARFIEGLASHYVLDDGRLVVAHAGMKEALQGRGSGRVRQFALYGDTTGESDDYGLPVRLDWAAAYAGKAAVVYGHTPVEEAIWINNTLCIDTGCVFGGKLTALRYPEREIVSVPAARVYCEPVRPLRRIAPEVDTGSDSSL